MKERGEKKREGERERGRESESKSEIESDKMSTLILLRVLCSISGNLPTIEEEDPGEIQGT